jgi:O-antigen ligase
MERPADGEGPLRDGRLGMAGTLVSFVQRCVGWVFLVALGFVPLIFGANVPLAWGINAAVFGGLLALFSLTQAITGTPPQLPARRLAVPLITFGLVMLWIYVQGQPWTPAWMHAPEWAHASELLGEQLPGRISVNPGEAFLGLLRLATASAVFLLALQLGRDPVWATRIIGAFAIAAALQAIWALTLAAVGPESLSRLLPASLFKFEQRDGLTGTFYNRSHFAIYMALGLICTWGLLSRSLRMSLVDHGFRDRRELLARIIGIGRGLARYSVLLMPIVLGLLLSNSRAGVLLGFSAVLIMVFMDNRHTKHSKAIRRTALGIAILGAAFSLGTRGDMVGTRLAKTTAENTVDDRIATATITLRAIEARPVLGYGYGSFSSVFPQFRDDTLPLLGRWKDAHNSYLEAILGLGAPMAVILFVGFAWIVGVCVRGVLKRRRDRLSPSVAVAASLVIALHVLVDFSIQIQGVALGFAALLGTGYAQAWSSRDREAT